MKNICFFGHRNLWGRDIRDRLKNELQSHLEDEVHCFVGTHGEFDSLALSVCRELRRTYKNLKITVIFTSLNILKKDKELEYSIADNYDDVETMIYDIEEEHFKNQIVVSNRRMVDDCSIVICYVDMKEFRSGAKRAVNYAKKQGKQIINLFQEQDRPFYGMTKEEIEAEWEKRRNELKSNTKK